MAKKKNGKRRRRGGACQEEDEEARLPAMETSSSSSSRRRRGPAVGEEQVERGEEGEEALMGRLTDDCLVQVLRCLPTRFLLSSPALVCRRWHRLCLAHLVLELIPPSFGLQEKPWGSLKEADFMELVRCYAATIEKLSFYGLNRLKSEEIIFAIASVPRLKHLSIISCPLLVLSDLKGIIDTLPSSLTSFNIYFDHCLNPKCHNSLQSLPPLIDDEHVGLLVRKCPNLENLDLDGYSAITGRGLDSLLLALPMLKRLDLHNDIIGWPQVTKIFERCKSLHHLSVVSALFGQDPVSSDDEDVGGLSLRLGKGRGGGFRGRERCFLTDSKGFNFSCVPLSLSSIRFYTSPHCSVPLDIGPLYAFLKDRGYGLRCLHAQSVYNTSWHMISLYCANLQTLDLSHARDVLHQLTEIEELVLCGIPRLLRNLVRVSLPALTDRVLIEFGRYNPKLKEIRSEGHSATKSLPNVQALVSDRGVLALSEGCSSLVVLSLAGCQKVTASSLRALAFHCRMLKALRLTGCLQIKDDGIATLLSLLGNSLFLLDLIGCSKLTLASIKHVIEHVQAYSTSMRVLAISPLLLKSACDEISVLAKLKPSLSVRTRMAPWDGFYHAPEHPL